MTEETTGERRCSLEDLAVLVVNYRTHALVEENLLRSLGGDFPGQVVVVDNHSTDQERAAVTEVCRRHGWTLLTAPNVGFGAGNNLAAGAALEAGSRVLLLLNPDAWLEPGAVERLHRRVEDDPSLVLAPLVMRPDGRRYSEENDLHLDRGEMLWTRLRHADADPDRIHTWVSGACVAISAEMWSACGGFDDDYFLYWEDVDLSRRVVEAGGHVRVDPDLVAVHDEGSSQDTGGAGRKSPGYFYYNARNRLLYAAKHLTGEDQRAWVRATPLMTVRLARQGGRRQLLAPRSSLWPAVRGSWDGASYVRRHPRGVSPARPAPSRAGGAGRGER